MIRLVFGLGTRAVDRNDDDYVRIVALNAPARRPEANIDQARKYTQQKVDCLDLEAREFISKPFAEVVSADGNGNLLLELFASRDKEMEKRAARLGQKEIFSWAITFENLLTKTDFAKDMREMLKIVEDVYDSQVDIEFTVNFLSETEYKINLLQCRPLEMKGGPVTTDPTTTIKPQDILIEARGPIVGQSRQETIDQIIYVAPDEYLKLKNSDRYELARLIGRLSHIDSEKGKTIMLLGPGRWGTSTPSLGVPVSYPEINTISVLVEIAMLNKEMSADISLGTHFFNDLIESDTLYLGLLPHRQGNKIRTEFFENSPNILSEIFPDAQQWANVLKVINPEKVCKGRTINLYANAIEQKFICYCK